MNVFEEKQHLLACSHRIWKNSHYTMFLRRKHKAPKFAHGSCNLYLGHLKQEAGKIVIFACFAFSHNSGETQVTTWQPHRVIKHNNKSGIRVKKKMDHARRFAIDTLVQLKKRRRENRRSVSVAGFQVTQSEGTKMGEFAGDMVSRVSSSVREAREGREVENHSARHGCVIERTR